MSVRDRDCDAVPVMVLDELGVGGTGTIAMPRKGFADVVPSMSVDAVPLVGRR